jgi:hypothetical protein
MSVEGRRVAAEEGVRDTGTRATQAVLIIVGVLHLLPSTGMVSSERLGALYGITLPDADLVILMRHRAVLFGILGLIMIGGAFREEMTGVALGAGITSVASFIALALLVGGYGVAVGRVVAIDAAALLLLGMGALLHFGRGRRSNPMA